MNLRDFIVERSYKAPLDAMPAVIIGVDNDGRIELLNKMAEQVTGYTEDEVRGREFAPIFLLPESQSLNYFGAPEWNGDSDIPLKVKDGDTHLIRWFVVPIIEERGNKFGYLGLGLDVTYYHLREQEIFRLAHLNRRILDSIPISILMLDEDLNILDVNRNYIERRQKKFPPIWKNIAEVFPSHMLENTGLRDALNECLKTGQPKEFTEVLHYSEEHETRWLDIRIYPLEQDLYKDRLFPKLILAIDDVTGHVKMRRKLESVNEIIVMSNHELQRTMEQLRNAQSELLKTEKLASVGQLADGVAHEINNPIAYVLSNLHTLRKYHDEFRGSVSQYRELITKCGDNKLIAEMEEMEKRVEIDYLLDDMSTIVVENIEGANRIRDIVRDLSTFSHADVGRVSKVNINHLVESAVKISFNEIKHRARLNMNLENIPEIYVDTGQLSQVFLNIIMNAAQAIPEGHSDSDTISVESGLEDNVIVVSIRDTGKGIPDDILTKIFDPFFTTKEVGEGSGLGLAICRNIVKQHKGEILVESKPGAGTTFHVILPVENGLEPPKTVEEDEKSGLTATQNSRLRVLLIDDDENLIKSQIRLLKPYHNLVTAQGGQAGLDLLANDGNFDVILCDMMMPDIDGMEIHAYLKKQFPDRVDKIIFLTGGAFTSRTKTFIDNVNNYVLEKPVELSALLSTIRKVAGYTISQD